MNQTGFIFTELATDVLQDGKWFDGLAVGEFTDMWGSHVEVKDDHLNKYVDNTLAAILVTETESGEIVGLPIDAVDHNRGQASGWIVDVRLADDKIQFLPKWTEIGIELIEKGTMRFFSATFSVKKKVILGGTLTNWPATRNEKEEILLKPIELSSGDSSNLFVFTTEIEAAEVPDGDQDTDDEEFEQPENPKGVENMVDLTELTDEQRAALKAEAREQVLSELAPAKNDDDTQAERITRLRKEINLEAFAELSNIEDIREAFAQSTDEVLLAELKRQEQYQARRMAQMLAETRRVNEIAEFCAKATGGDDEAPRGLPIQSDELETFMLSLDKEQRKAAENFFGRILESGLTDFTELGHGRDMKQGTKELPEGVDRQLAQHIERGGDIAQFFDAANDILGEMSQYNLAAYKEKDNG